MPILQKLIFIVSILLISIASLLGQSDTIPLVDSTNVIQLDSLISDSLSVPDSKFSLKQFLKADYPDPNKAALLAIIPGGGQAYNKKYWKIPIVYAGLGTTIYFASRDEKRYRFYRNNYRYRVDNDANTAADIRLATLSDETLKTIRNRYDKRRQQLYAGTLAVWLLQAMDAYVDAHLTNFDIDEDLTLHIDPIFHTYPTGNNLSFGLKLNLSTPPKAVPRSFISLH